MHRSLRRALSALVLAAALLAAFASSAFAPGTPDLQLSGGPAASVLYGNQVPVDLTASIPAGEPKGYNLAFRAVLPAGTSYVAGSAGTIDGEPTIINNAPTTGKTTLIWENVDDLVPSSSHTLSFKVAYNDTSSASTPIYDVGDPLPIDTGAYISTEPRDETDFDSLGNPVGPGAGTYTGKAEQSTVTQLTAIKVAKSEPHPEGEIPRGLHDHQTVYTLKVTNNGVNPTNGVSLEDYIPAGLEFLGCAGTADHTTDAPTNPGSTNEYKGSGPITVSHPTAAENCVAPDLVETVYARSRRHRPAARRRLHARQVERHRRLRPRRHADADLRRRDPDPREHDGLERRRGRRPARPRTRPAPRPPISTTTAAPRPTTSSRCSTARSSPAPTRRPRSRASPSPTRARCCGPPRTSRSRSRATSARSSRATSPSGR